MARRIALFYGATLPENPGPEDMPVGGEVPYELFVEARAAAARERGEQPAGVAASE
jgi:hypothetical protein